MRREEQEAALKLMSLEAMVRDFEGVALDLAQQIAAEEARTGITDPTHFAYSTFATAARIRRSNLSTTIADLSARLDSARRDHDAMTAELQDSVPSTSEPGDHDEESAKGPLPSARLSSPSGSRAPSVIGQARPARA